MEAGLPNLPEWRNECANKEEIMKKVVKFGGSSLASARQFKKEFVAGNINFMGIEKIEDGMRFRTKIRYAHGGAMATLYKEKDKNIRFVFDEKQRAITSGQSAVFYDGDCVAGGGVIL